MEVFVCLSASVNRLIIVNSSSATQSAWQIKILLVALGQVVECILLLKICRIFSVTAMAAILIAFEREGISLTGYTLFNMILFSTKRHNNNVYYTSFLT